MKNINDGLLLYKLYASIQTKGLRPGKPAIFLKLGTCNFKCPFCDSPQTWNFEKYSRYDNLRFVFIEEIISAIKSLLRLNPGIRTVVITGGEPLLQQGIFPFGALLKKLKKELSILIEIETNGSILPLRKIRTYVDTWNVSLKLSNSGMKKGMLINIQAINFFRKLLSTSFNIVITDIKDLLEINEIVTVNKIDASKVSISPFAKDTKSLIEMYKQIFVFCKSNGYSTDLSTFMLMFLGMDTTLFQ